MGDTGSLTLGATLATIAIHQPRTIISSYWWCLRNRNNKRYNPNNICYFLQKKVFLMTPIHHHFERLGWRESDIVKLFWIVGFLLCLLALIYGVWL